MDRGQVGVVGGVAELRLSTEAMKQVRQGMALVYKVYKVI